MSQILSKWIVKAPTSMETAVDGSLAVKLAAANAIEATVDGLIVKAAGIQTAHVADAAITEAKLANQFVRTDGVNTFSANQSLGGFKLTNVATPTDGTDATNKSYVDARLAGLTWKDATVAATTANITLSGLQTIDTVAVKAGDRVLVKDQTAQEENGIYVASATAWSRSSDLDEATPVNEFKGAAVWVDGGSAWAQTGWAQNNAALTDVGIDPVTWAQFNGAASLDAGNGLSKSGNTLSANVDGSTLEIAADNIQIKDAGVITAKLADDAVTAAKINADVAGNGLAQNVDGSLEVTVDGSTLEITADSLNVKDLGITTAKLAASAVTTIKIIDDAVTAAKINADVAGNGLVQATGGELDVNVDNITLEITADALNLKDGGISTAKLASTSITAAKLNADVAGLGLSLDGTTNALNVNTGNGLVIDTDKVKLTALTTSWDLGGLSGVTITNAPAPINATDLVNKDYVDAAVSSANSRQVQVFTLGATEITNKYVTLAAVPADASRVVANVKGAPFQVYGDDFAMDNTNADRVTWSALGLDGLVAAGDKIIVEYDV
jgi:hypothetical protein